jgi:microcystin-dependent protein/cytoskeletal protein CcmA (bactofilin family)
MATNYYNVNFTDTANNTALTVSDNSVNEQTNLTFVGRNTRGYAEAVAEDFLHLLENFAAASPPDQTVGGQPIKGQLWYDTTTGVNELKVYDGQTWKAAGSVKKGLGQPNPSTVGGVAGDLYVDTLNQQLYLYSGSTWILVGPSFSSGTRTGIQAAILLDALDVSHTVLEVFINDSVVAIYSFESFALKTSIAGFSTLNPGLNLATLYDSSNNPTTKFWGVSEKAQSLLINGQSIAGNKFIRNDQDGIISGALTVRSDGGLTIGSSGQIRLQVDNNLRAFLYHSQQNSALDLRINKNGTATTLIRLDATTGNGYVGINNLTPTANLDVTGTANISGQLTLGGALNVNSTTSTTSTSSGALVVAGGVGIAKGLTLGGVASITNTTNSTSPTTGALVVAGGAGIAQDLRVAGNVYVTGNIAGNITGNVTGTAGSAIQLTHSTTFKITGDMIDDTGISFNGSSTVSTQTFNTVLNPGFVSSKTLTSTTDNSDLLLIYSQNTNIRTTGLYSIRKDTFISDLGLIQPGMIFPYAGTVSVIPTGYLLCDGSQVPQSIYPDLYAVLGNTYGTPTAGSGTFYLPDLRGRFALGNLGMANTVSNMTATPIDPAAVNRATGSTATTLGNAAGLEQTSLTTNNLPDHRHTLTDSQGTQFSVVNPSPTSADVSGNREPALGGAANGSQFYNYTSGVDSASHGQAFNIMNPYLTINYIIYVGKIA